MAIRTIDELYEKHRTDTISCQVVEMVADARGVDPLELPPIYEAIDPDFLDGRFAPSSAHGPEFGEVAFTYIGYEITVSYDGEVVIMLNEESSSPNKE